MHRIVLAAAAALVVTAATAQVAPSPGTTEDKVATPPVATPDAAKPNDSGTAADAAPRPDATPAARPRENEGDERAAGEAKKRPQA